MALAAPGFTALRSLRPYGLMAPPATLMDPTRSLRTYTGSYMLQPTHTPRSRTAYHPGCPPSSKPNPSITFPRPALPLRARHALGHPSPIGGHGRRHLLTPHFSSAGAPTRYSTTSTRKITAKGAKIHISTAQTHKDRNIQDKGGRWSSRRACKWPSFYRTSLEQPHPSTRSLMELEELRIKNVPQNLALAESFPSLPSFPLSSPHGFSSPKSHAHTQQASPGDALTESPSLPLRFRRRLTKTLTSPSRTRFSSSFPLLSPHFGNLRELWLKGEENLFSFNQLVPQLHFGPQLLKH